MSWLKRNTWLISLLGVLALALLIWFIGPLLSIAGWEPLVPEWNRGLTIVVLLLLWGGYQLVSWLRARRSNAQMLEGLAGTPADASARAAAEQLDELQKNFAEALKILKKVRPDRNTGAQHLYQLPWYIIIGPPGAGKTTALLHSGLHFPLADRLGQGKVRGVGGTRDCDWFFTDEAVLLDTAGRYTTQDSQQAVDARAWLGFLDLLKQHRRRRPINGVLVAVSLSDLLQSTAAERAQQAQAIKDRIQELHQRLGIRFPIYVLFTKADLVAGFTEFFDDLGKDERAQVWGMTFPLDEDPESRQVIVDRFAGEFDPIEARLNARLLERLQQQRDPHSRDLTYLFPQQFGSLKTIAEEFLRAAFQPSRFEEPALLRGVYFTSGTQEGTPIDRLLGSLAETFRLNRAAVAGFSGRGKSYFLTRLLREVVFPEAGLAGANLRLEQQRQRLQWAAYAGAFALTGLIAALWLTSYFRNELYIANVEQQAQALQTQINALPSPDRGEVLPVLPVLDAARRLPGGYDEREQGTPLLMGLGLYQGDKLGEGGAVPLYQRLLRNLFLTRILRRLENRLNQSGDPEVLYQVLTVYLMLDDRSHYQPAVVRDWLLQDWRSNPGNRATAEQHQALANHLAALLELLPGQLPFSRDPALIERVRTQLQQIPPEQRVYNRLRQELGDSRPAFNPAQAGGGNFATAFARRSGKPLSEGVPGLYTYDGYHQVFNPAIDGHIQELAEESWVLGEQGRITDPAALLPLVVAVRNLYLRDYVRRWDELLADFGVRPLGNLAESVDIVNVLAGPESPLIRFLKAVVRETTLAAPPPAPAGAATAATAANAGAALAGGVAAANIAAGAASAVGASGVAGSAAGAAATASGLLSAGTAATDLRKRLSLPPAGPADVSLVDDHFAPLRRLVQDGELNQATALLNELHVHLANMASAKDRGEGALAAAGKQAESVVNKLRQSATRQPPPLNRILKSLADDAASITQGRAVSALNAFWGPGLSFCQASIANRYPIDRAGKVEITPADFGRFFGPGGVVDQYFQKYLEPFVDTTRKPWQAKDPQLGLSPAALLEFQRAAEIRDAFFGGAGTTPAARFELKPLVLDEEFERIQLDLDGQPLSYSHGPTRGVALQWPGPQGSSTARLEFAPSLPDGRSGLTRDGPWNWFRLLDTAELKGSSDPTRFILTFRLGTRIASFELRAATAVNPFNLQALEKFRCPPRL